MYWYVLVHIPLLDRCASDSIGAASLPLVTARTVQPFHLNSLLNTQHTTHSNFSSLAAMVVLSAQPWVYLQSYAYVLHMARVIPLWSLRLLHTHHRDILLPLVIPPESAPSHQSPPRGCSNPPLPMPARPWIRSSATCTSLEGHQRLETQRSSFRIRRQRQWASR